MDWSKYFDLSDLYIQIQQTFEVRIVETQIVEISVNRGGGTSGVLRLGLVCIYRKVKQDNFK